MGFYILLSRVDRRRIGKMDGVISMSPFDPTRLTSHQIQILLFALQHKYGQGYSKIPAVGNLQAKLSIMGQMQAKMGDTSHEQPIPDGIE